ncbi:Leucine-rich repeat and guanylate kinase domain-containing protein [Channa argus]|uniref:Leucine-rich repeat and guanylate kinase domain-containing protein n=1 Tax=Channa argus TaxID=215402 RepID=A0A6G1QRM8_CHAAH|nr:Leucine-rich repeat and guanylate kinase domain-containing protein [Channa argus]
MQYGGHSFGLTRDAIEDVAREGLACCVHMELEGVFSLKKCYLEPRYVLLFPTHVEKYAERLKARGLYTPAQIDMAVSRIELYANTNRQRPGFFDNVIPCGNELEQKPLSPLSRSGSGTLTALDPSEPSHRNYYTKIQAELSPQMSPAELASIRRRERLVREALVGKSPGVYSQLFKSTVQKAPSSLQTHDSGTSISEDSSSDETRPSSALSVPSSAGALAGLVEPLDNSVVGQTSETVKDPLALDQATDNTCMDTDQQAATVSLSSERRPGSNVMPILPPIPTGRKTPAVPSPAPSPRPTPNPAVG